MGEIKDWILNNLTLFRVICAIGIFIGATYLGFLLKDKCSKSSNSSGK